MSFKFLENKPGQIFRWIATRAVTLYLLIILLSPLIVNYNQVLDNAIPATMSRLMPSFEYFVDVLENDEKFDRKKLEDYEQYFENSVRFMPSNAEGYGLLGFCYYHLGKDKKAIIVYRQAMKNNRYFFWYPYNLGFIYFEGGQYKKAVEAFEQAINIPPDRTLVTIGANKILRPILVSKKARNYSDQSLERLRMGFLYAHIYSILSYYQLEDFENVLRLAGQAIESNLGRQEFFYYYEGIAAYHLGRYQEAARAFQQCIKRRPNYADAFHYLGLSLQAVGEERAAIEMLRRATILRNTLGDLPLIEKKMGLQVF